jgi:hypothetical protein
MEEDHSVGRYILRATHYEETPTGFLIAIKLEIPPFAGTLLLLVPPQLELVSQRRVRAAGLRCDFGEAFSQKTNRPRNLIILFAVGNIFEEAVIPTFAMYFGPHSPQPGVLPPHKPSSCNFQITIFGRDCHLSISARQAYAVGPVSARNAPAILPNSASSRL